MGKSIKHCSRQISQPSLKAMLHRGWVFPAQMTGLRTRFAPCTHKTWFQYKSSSTTMESPGMFTPRSPGWCQEFHTWHFIFIITAIWFVPELTKTAGNIFIKITPKICPFIFFKWMFCFIRAYHCLELLHNPSPLLRIQFRIETCRESTLWPERCMYSPQELSYLPIKNAFSTSPSHVKHSSIIRWTQLAKCIELLKVNAEMQQLRTIMLHVYL